MARRNDGKALELALQQALETHKEQHKSTYVRLYDATSSGGRGHAQVGDFIWLLPKCAVLLECKSSETGADLMQLVKGSKTSRAQVARHRLWHIAQHPSIYIHADLVTKEVKAYDGGSVVRRLADSKAPLGLVGITGLTSMTYLLTYIDEYLSGDLK